MREPADSSTNEAARGEELKGAEGDRPPSSRLRWGRGASSGVAWGLAALPRGLTVDTLLFRARLRARGLRSPAHRLPLPMRGVGGRRRQLHDGLPVTRVSCWRRSLSSHCKRATSDETCRRGTGTEGEGSTSATRRQGRQLVSCPALLMVCACKPSYYHTSHATPRRSVSL